MMELILGEKGIFSVLCQQLSERESSVYVSISSNCVKVRVSMEPLRLSNSLETGGGKTVGGLGDILSVLLQWAVKHCIWQDRNLQLLIRPAVFLW